MEITRNVWHVGCRGQHLLDHGCRLGREGFALLFALLHLGKFYHGWQYEQPLSLSVVRQNASNSSTQRSRIDLAGNFLQAGLLSAHEHAVVISRRTPGFVEAP